MAAVEKDSMRELALRGGPYTSEECAALLTYCESDVDATQRLLTAMLPSLDAPRAVFRGQYQKSVAHMEYVGIPVDSVALGVLRDNWGSIQDELIRQIDSDFGVYEKRMFKVDRFAKYLADRDIPWPRLESGRLALDDETFREMTKSHPQLIPLEQLRIALSGMRLSDLAVGTDGRNRTLLSPFRSKTGRNQPSTSRFIFGPSVWLRHLIRPEPGTALAYVDWEQQEFGIAAALSRDRAMMTAYFSGDPYLEFAKQARAAPNTATRITHAAIRELFKTCVLGVQFGMEAEGLARRIEKSVVDARNLLRAHRETYPTFWAWSDAAVDQAMLHGSLQTVFGWRIQVGSLTNPRTLRNFPMQANGAEMLRLACCRATAQGIRVCAPVHDAILVESPLDQLLIFT